jgi:LPS O-antigen subunit length determinant protein (WzzB/FepE family)
MSKVTALKKALKVAAGAGVAKVIYDENTKKKPKTVAPAWQGTEGDMAGFQKYKQEMQRRGMDVSKLKITGK